VGRREGGRKGRKEKGEGGEVTVQPSKLREGGKEGGREDLRPSFEN